ncbi:hypothetical protein Actkin_05187 [Actinokineospora sp. UTMC 2448]|nr:hypothetical protein Actkin_05187 [Actinokineospora sp. UTMC 2448]
MHYPEGITGTLPATLPQIFPSGHHTVSMFERYTIDANRCLIHDSILRVIAAREDNLNYYTYSNYRILDRFELIAGGQIDQVYEDDEHNRTLYKIRLDQPLRKGQTAALQYRAHYKTGYRPREVRRAFTLRYENVDIAVQFHPTQTPASVHFCIWDSYTDPNPIQQVPITLDQAGTVHRFVPYVQQSAIGYQWTW